MVTYLLWTVALCAVLGTLLNMSMFRNTVWFVKGLREYTKSGYEKASKGFNSGDLDCSCSGKNALITGANSGIGKCIALELARRGAVVHMVCRNPNTAETAKQEIIEASNNANVQVHLLDLSRPREVIKFAKDFVNSSGALDILVNNAGCMVHEHTLDEDGIEVNFATNTLAPHILVAYLSPLLKKSDESRVITVSSGGMLVQKLNCDDLQFLKMKPFDGTMAYAQNKRQQVVLNELYAKMYPEIHFSCMHPGWADTPAVKSAMPQFHSMMGNKLRTPEQGADTAVWLAVSRAARALPSGLFYQDRVPVSTHLPMAWTKSTEDENRKLMSQMDELVEKLNHEA